jgi:hypothetical protein
LPELFVRPAVAALVYGDSCDHFWGDVVLKKGDRFVQVGSLQRAPLCSSEKALECIKSQIATIKATREDPIVQKLRDRGIRPESLELLRVHHEEHGCRWVLMDEKRREREAESYVRFLEENKIRDSLYWFELARRLVLDNAGQLLTDPEAALLDVTNEMENSTCPTIHAARYLLKNGVHNIDDRDVPNLTVIVHAEAS